jgi:anaerobic selenocysteine-containing dehydrogenase
MRADDRSVSRRALLAGGAGGLAAAAVGAGTAAAGDAGPTGPTGASLGVDRIVRTTCSPNCTGACGQLAFVRGERIVKIQQAADYPDPAYNPRGCMKGLSYHQLIDGEDRITTPLVRTGPRGSGEFREASWDEALERVTEGMKAIGERWGWDAIHVFGQVPGSGYVQKGAAYRAAALLGMTHGTSFDFNGDLPMGMPITFGVQNAEHEAKDWANSRFLLVVGANLLETRIPDAHFVFDAVAAGARLVVVDPVYSATAAKADAWLPIRAGTDTAFALSVAATIVEEGLAEPGFLHTYTDAPPRAGRHRQAAPGLRPRARPGGGRGPLRGVGPGHRHAPAGPPRPARDPRRRRRCARGHVPGPARRRHGRGGLPGVRARTARARGPHPRAGCGDHRPRVRARAPGGEGLRHHRTRRDPHGRGCQPLVPR